MDTSRISPTAHYTGYVWYANGLSCDALATSQGKKLYQSLTPMNAFYERWTAGPSLNQMLLQRHVIIDHILTEAIVSGAIGQVIEVAAGLSPRGWRLKRKFRKDLVYIEGDLPEMAALKRGIMENAGLLSPGHHILPLNALLDDGEQSLSHIGEQMLDPSVGTAIITEGLLSYFDPVSVDGMWKRFASLLRNTNAGGIYLTDLHIKSDLAQSWGSKAFKVALTAFARGSIHVHFQSCEEARSDLMLAGFTNVQTLTPARMVNTLAIPAPLGKTRLRIVNAEVALQPAPK